MEVWVSFTLLAALMQSLRTAGQKKITEKISIQAATLVRFVFGIKFVIAYFLFIFWVYEPLEFGINLKFFLFGALASIAQILATVCLINVVSMKNFAVGTSLAKTESILIAVLGTLFFSSPLSIWGYVSVLIGSAGLVFASQWKVSLGDKANFNSLSYGLCAGLGFALASLWIRSASLSLEVDPIPEMMQLMELMYFWVYLELGY